MHISPPSHPPGAAPRARPLFHGMVAVDIVSFGTRRDPDIQLQLRDAAYGVLKRGCGDVGIQLDGDRRLEDRGDGALLVTSPWDSIESLIEMVPAVRAGIRHYNKGASEAAQMHLRMAVHAGLVYDDENGVTGHHVNFLFRLLNADPLKHLIASQGSDFGLVTSEFVYSEVVQYATGAVDPAEFAPVHVQEKEMSDQAMIYVPAPGGTLTRAQSSPDPSAAWVDRTPCNELLVLLLAAGARPQDIAALTCKRNGVGAQSCTVLTQLLSAAGAHGMEPDQLHAVIHRLLIGIQGGED